MYKRQPQEALTWKFFHNGAGSEKIENVPDFEHIIDAWMADPSAHSQVRERFLTLRYDEDPTLLIDDLVDLGNEVPQAKLKRRAFPPVKPGAAGGSVQRMRTFLPDASAGVIPLA